ncbi:molybdopterin-binding protein [Comamonas sp. GB3 AK4-5]|uniref:TOBE domain-containing protein n=1 Tax=Comamonas sp. GB3 AK4-5 TaxID=3231487 RepID=UPI00351EA76A
MQSSARNHFSGVVQHIQAGVVTDEVQIQTDSGAQLVATITHGSAQTLGLKNGSQVIALIKAPSVIVVTDAQGMRFSARNQLQGKVTAIKTGSVNSDVQIESQGLQVVAIITNDSASTLGLAPGKQATALFKASHVVLAVPA